MAAFAVGIAMASPAQAAGTVVNVSLWDKGMDVPMATDLGFPAAGKDMTAIERKAANAADANWLNLHITPSY